MPHDETQEVAVGEIRVFREMLLLHPALLLGRKSQAPALSAKELLPLRIFPQKELFWGLAVTHEHED